MGHKGGGPQGGAGKCGSILGWKTLGGVVGGARYTSGGSGGARVKWDAGSTNTYATGFHGKYALAVLGAAPVAALAATAAAATVGWSCAACTLVNDASCPTCAACGAAPGAAPGPAQPPALPWRSPGAA